MKNAGHYTISGNISYAVFKILGFILWGDISTVKYCIPPPLATAMSAFVPHYLNKSVRRGIVITIIRRKKQRGMTYKRYGRRTKKEDDISKSPLM